MQKIDENVLVFDLSTEGLNPLKCRIIGITTKDSTNERIFAKRQERELLVEFWQHINNGNYTQIVGYNSDDFDLPFLIIRSLKHGVKMCPIIRNSIDLRKTVFYGNNNRRGKLVEFQELMGVNFPESRYRKLDMYLMWSTPEIHDLQEFLLRDVKITWELYQHARETGLV